MTSSGSITSKTGSPASAKGFQRDNPIFERRLGGGLCCARPLFRGRERRAGLRRGSVPGRAFCGRSSRVLDLYKSPQRDTCWTAHPSLSRSVFPSAEGTTRAAIPGVDHRGARAGNSDGFRQHVTGNELRRAYVAKSMPPRASTRQVPVTSVNREGEPLGTGGTCSKGNPETAATVRRIRAPWVTTIMCPLG